MMPSDLSRESDSIRNQTQSILYVGIFIMGTLIVTPLILACSCCLRKIFCPKTLIPIDSNPIMESVVINPTKTIDGRVQRRIENVAHRQQLDFKYQSSCRNCEIKNSSRIQHISKPTQIPENDARFGEDMKLCFKNIQVQLRPNYGAENPVLGPTFTRTRSQHGATCCSRHNNSLHKTLSLPFPANSGSVFNKEMKLELSKNVPHARDEPGKIKSVIKDEDCFRSMSSAGEQICGLNVKCKYQDRYCARLQSMLMVQQVEGRRGQKGDLVNFDEL